MRECMKIWLKQVSKLHSFIVTFPSQCWCYCHIKDGIYSHENGCICYMHNALLSRNLLPQCILHIQSGHYSILVAAKKQLSNLPSAKQIPELETSCRTWNRLLDGFHPGQLSWLLTHYQLLTGGIYSAVHLCDFMCPTIAHVHSGCVQLPYFSNGTLVDMTWYSIL